MHTEKTASCSILIPIFAWGEIPRTGRRVAARGTVSWDAYSKEREWFISRKSTKIDKRVFPKLIKGALILLSTEFHASVKLNSIKSVTLPCAQFLPIY